MSLEGSDVPHGVPSRPPAVVLPVRTRGGHRAGTWLRPRPSCAGVGRSACPGPPVSVRRVPAPRPRTRCCSSGSALRRTRLSAPTAARAAAGVCPVTASRPPRLRERSLAAARVELLFPGRAAAAAVRVPGSAAPAHAVAEAAGPLTGPRVCVSGRVSARAGGAPASVCACDRGGRSRFPARGPRATHARDAVRGVPVNGVARSAPHRPSCGRPAGLRGGRRDADLGRSCRWTEARVLQTRHLRM